MQLNNLISVEDGHRINITISGNLISRVENTGIAEDGKNIPLYFDDAIVFPGLINSHDHLDFNCFPLLGNRTYNNYHEWGIYIHEHFKKEINSVLKIPESLRTGWGMYKNLLAGVTTVVNHGKELSIDNYPIRIIQDVQNLHSVRNEPNWKIKINNPLSKNKPCVIHVGEGTDQLAAAEIDELVQWNFLNRDLIGIHAVAMNAPQAENFKAIIWCPESNRFLLGADAPVKELKTQTQIVLGTDSTLTGSWNIWDHLRLAKKTKQAKDHEIFEMLTSAPAALWNLNKGSIATGKDADIVVAKRKSGNAMNSFFETNPEDILLIIQERMLKIFDASIISQLDAAGFQTRDFVPVHVNGTEKWVPHQMLNIIRSITEINPSVCFPCTVLENKQAFSL